MNGEQLGKYVYFRGEGCFPLGQDSLLLGRFATVKPNWKVCDLGCGDGVLPLLLMDREESLELTGIELDPAAADAAQMNLQRNDINGRIINEDIRKIQTILTAGSFDLVVSNPPYFALNSGACGGKMRMEMCCTLQQLCSAASWLTRNGGRFALVYRPERLAELMCELKAKGLEPKRMQMLQHGPDKQPYAVLLEAVHQGKTGLQILPTKLTGGC